MKIYKAHSSKIQSPFTSSILQVESTTKGLREPFYDAKTKTMYAQDETQKEIWKSEDNGALWVKVFTAGNWKFSGGIFKLSSGYYIGFVSESGNLIKINPDFSGYVTKSDTVRVSPLNSTLGFAEKSNGVIMFCEYHLTYRRIWKSVNQGDTWTIALEDLTIRHWHCLQLDPYTGHWWAASGDADAEVKILKSTDDGVTWTTMASGSQDYRAIGFVFRKNDILWSSDSPVAQSKIMKSAKDMTAQLAVGNIDGPSYGNHKTMDGRMLCYTYVEPGVGNQEYSILYLTDGVTVKEIMRLAIPPANVTRAGFHKGTDIDQQNRVWFQLHNTVLGDFPPTSSDNRYVMASILLPYGAM